MPKQIRVILSVRTISHRSSPHENVIEGATWCYHSRIAKWANKYERNSCAGNASHTIIKRNQSSRTARKTSNRASGGHSHVFPSQSPLASWRRDIALSEISHRYLSQSVETLNTAPLQKLPHHILLGFQVRKDAHRTTRCALHHLLVACDLKASPTHSIPAESPKMRTTCELPRSSSDVSTRLRNGLPEERACASGMFDISRHRECSCLSSCQLRRRRLPFG